MRRNRQRAGPLMGLQVEGIKSNLLLPKRSMLPHRWAVSSSEEQPRGMGGNSFHLGERDPAFPWRRWRQQQMEQGWLDSGGKALFMP